MSKLINKMAPFRSIYKTDFRNLTKEHDLVVGKDLSAKVDLSLTNPSYNVRRDRNSSHPKYDLLGSRYMKDMARVMGTS